MSERILQKKILLTETDHQTNISIPFELQQAADQLVIEFTYDPAEAEDEYAIVQIQKALNRFVPDAEQKKWGNVERYLPLKNLITLSLMYEQSYLGAHHKKDHHQMIKISSTEASKGFTKSKIKPGKWEIQLNAHCVAVPEVTVQLQVRTEATL